MNAARTAAAALAAAGIMTAVTACSGAAQKPPAPAATASATTANTAASLPGTPPGVQASWLLGALAHLPIPAAAATAHFDKTFLAKLPLSELNADLAGVQNLRLDSVALSTSEFIILSVTANGPTPLDATVSVDAHGLIDGLDLTKPPAEPPTAVPATWAAVDSQVRTAAPQVHLLVAQLSGGTCRPIQAIGATGAGPLGSAFKLYVLDALARAVAAGTVSWDQRVTLTSQLTSLPSGELSTEPAGTQLTVLQAAEDMISSSDNTAADLLINLVGRTAVEAAAAGTGMADPALDTPFLTTRELFILKLDDWPALASRYLALNSAGRQAMLTGTVDRAPLPALSAATAWTAPRDIDGIEWFASPADICNVYASLAALASRPGLAPVASILEINDGGLKLNPGQWRSVWFKGGSEPGVITLNYLATTRGGQSYLVSVLAANPTAPIPAAQTKTLLTDVRAAFGLAAG